MPINRFSLVANCINELKQHRTPGKLREALRKLPKDTKAAYGTILKGILENEAYRAYAIRTFQWLSFSKRPLAALELRDLLATDSSNGFDENERLRAPSDVLDCCPSFIEMYSMEVDELSEDFNDAEKERMRADAAEATPNPFTIKVSFVRLAQPHLKEFLESDPAATTLGTRETLAHALLARYCLLYLRELRSPEDIKRLPACVYAAARWDSHLRAAVRSSDQTDDLLDLTWTIFSGKQLRENIRAAAHDDVDVSRLRHFAEKGIRPLVLRCLQGKKAKGANYQQRLNDALRGAARNRRKRAAELLLENGATVDVDTLKDAMVKRNSGLVKILIDRAELGNVENGELLCLSIERKIPAVFEILLEKLQGVDAIVDPEKNWTALHVATYYGRPFVVRQLVELGARKDLKDNESRTPLDLAMELNREAVMDNLRES